MVMFRRGGNSIAAERAGPAAPTAGGPERWCGRSWLSTAEGDAASTPDAWAWFRSTARSYAVAPEQELPAPAVQPKQ